MSASDKYVRIPFSDKETADQIRDVLSVEEMKTALVQAHNEEVETASSNESEDELAKYDNMRELRNDDSLTPAKRKQLEIKAKSATGTTLPR